MKANIFSLCLQKGLTFDNEKPLQIGEQKTLKS